MAKFNNVVIVSDMDGTFFGKGARIVPENVDAIRYFNENGGKFTFITGRNHPAVAFDPLLFTLVNAPIGFHNGAHIYDTIKNETVFETYIPTNTALEVTKYLMTLPDSIDFTLRCAFAFHKIEGKNSNDYNIISNRYNCCTVVGYDDFKNLKINKIVFSALKLEDILPVRDYIEKTYDTLECTSAGPLYIEIMPKGISKATVIPKLRKLPGYENAKIFAIGDYENDVEMLKTADYGACPENALDTAKAAATIHVCHHDKGAVADLIRIIEEKYLG